ncbi:MAG TPA: DUF1820 family protein [Coxiellaceae bacterium]|nr:DUF1820 family protein [Coxiellaceae bacterium]
MSDYEAMYRITFRQKDQVYQILARYISEESLMGFIEVEDLVFPDKNQLVLDPTEEKLKKEFEGVRRAYIPMHEVIRIDEVMRKGAAKLIDFNEKKSNVTRLHVQELVAPKEDNPISR